MTNNIYKRFFKQYFSNNVCNILQPMYVQYLKKLETLANKYVQNYL